MTRICLVNGKHTPGSEWERECPVLRAKRVAPKAPDGGIKPSVRACTPFSAPRTGKVRGKTPPPLTQGPKKHGSEAADVPASPSSSVLTRPSSSTIEQPRKRDGAGLTPALAPKAPRVSRVPSGPRHKGSHA